MRSKKLFVILLSIILSLTLVWVIPSNADEITHVVNFSPADLIFGEIEGFDTIKMKEGSFTREPGKPQLPLKVMHFAIPSDKNVVSVELITGTSAQIPGEFNVYPAQESKRISIDPEEFTPPDSDVYSSDVSYPLNRLELKAYGKIGGGKIATIHIYPLEYIPVDQRLILHTSLQIRIVLETDPVWSPPVVRNETIKEFFWGIVANHKVVEEYTVPPMFGDPIDYLIITSDSFIDSNSNVFQPLIDNKALKGLSVMIESVENIGVDYSGSDLQEKIRNFIIDKYTNNGVQWVLLGGDTDIVPAREVWGVYTSVLCDMYYSHLDGDWDFDADLIYGELIDDVDLYPDVFVGRAPVEDESEAEAFVDKILTYQANVSTYDHNLLFLGCEDFGDAGGTGKDFIDQHYIPPDFDPIVKYYERNISAYSAMTITAMNTGFHLINHIDHAWIDELSTGGDSMFISDIDGLTNGSEPSILWSCGCWPAAIDYDCIAEHWITNPNGGGAAFVGNSRYGLHPESDHMLDPEFYRSLFIKGYNHIGQTLADSKLNFVGLLATSTNMRYAMFELNLLGDPELEIAISRAPMDLALVLDFSGSMLTFGSCEDTPLLRKFEVLQQGVDSLLNAWEPFAVPEDRVGVMYFSSDIDPLGGPTMVNLLANFESVITDVYAQSPGGCTALGGAVLKAADAIDQTRLKKHMIILTNGMQNVNPMIESAGDIDFDGVDEHHAISSGGACGDSSVPPRPGFYLDTFDINMHTISIGASSGTAADLLSAVAAETEGLYDNTCKPPAELEEIFINYLVEALRQDTVELGGFETGKISSSDTCCYPHYTFPMNGSVTRAVFMLSWTAEPGETGKLNLRLFTPKGFEVPLASYEKRGNSFHRVVLDFPMFLPSHPYKPLDFVGDWEVVIKPEPDLKGSNPVIYRTYLLVDDKSLNFDISVDKTTVFTGEPIPLHVRVTEGKKPLRPRIEVRVQKPRTSVANILSTANIDTDAYASQFSYTYGLGEVLSSPLALAYEAVYLIPEYAALLVPIDDTVTVYDDGTHGDAVSQDGTYSGLYYDTQIPGKYQFDFYVDGNSTFHGPYHREKRCTATAVVRILTTPNLDIDLLGTSVQGGNFKVVITPQDSIGNYLGPGYTNVFDISIPNAVAITDVHDNNDGTYTQTFSVNNFVDVTSGDVMIFGNQLALTELDDKIQYEIQMIEGPAPAPRLPRLCCYQWGICPTSYQWGWPYLNQPYLNQQYLSPSYAWDYGYLRTPNSNPAAWAVPQISLAGWGSPYFTVSGTGYDFFSNVYTLQGIDYSMGYSMGYFGGSVGYYGPHQDIPDPNPGGPVSAGIGWQQQWNPLYYYY